MSCHWRKAITIVVVATVIYVFISPVFALDPSANRAWRAALQVMLSLALLVSVAFAFELPLPGRDLFVDAMKSRGSPYLPKFSSVSLC